jgi:arylsulfatase A-like enzyme
MKRNALFLGILMPLALTFLWLPGVLLYKQHPNILIVTIDDLGFHDLSCYGSPLYETPQIDAFREASYSFASAYANYPRCTPSRYAMMTANYPVKEFDIDLSQTPAESNFIRQFQKAGYQSYYVGKWHLGGDKNLPPGFGFDRAFGSGEAGGTASHFYPFNTKKVITPRGEVPPLPDVTEAGQPGDYLTDVLTDEMIDFIRQHDRSKPFFAMLSTYAVHTPLEAKPEDIQRNTQQIAAFDFGDQPEFVPEGNGVTKMRQDNPVYAAMVENMDYNFGRILQVLESEGLTWNTIVVFTSDHGGLSNKGSTPRELATSNYPLRAGKGHLYEGGIRVPLMIRWPDGISPSTNQESIVALMDLMPTLLDLATDQQLAKVDGKSFEKVIAGKENWPNRSLFFYEDMARPNLTGDFPCIAMRSGKYKLLHFYQKNTFELYDLETDPEEQINLIEKETAIASGLKDQLNTWRSEYLDSNK